MQKNSWTLLIFIIFFHPGSFAAAQNLVINEFLASNASINFDSDSVSGDWVELYNAGADTAQLAGLWLTDEAALPDKWSFPAGNLPPGGFLLVWATGKDRIAPALHSNFKLNAGGEFIGLYAADGTAIDTLSFGDQSTDVSFGRFPDGSANWQFMPTPTPAAANNVDGVVQNYKLKFSHPSNIYSQSIRLEMHTVPPGGEIHFTTDGTEPVHTSRVYQAPMNLNEISVIRARVFAGTTPKSELETRTYIINDQPHLPVLSLVTDPANLWSQQTGIYENWDKQGDTWERPAHLRLIEDGKSKFSAPVGIRIHGNSSRSLEKKNFRVYFRSEYGEADLDYRLVPQKETRSFKRLMLYAPSGDQPTGASNWNMLYDVLVHALFQKMVGLVSGLKPVALYLNTQYWGIYWLRERVDKYFAATYLGFSEIDLMRTSRSWRPDLRTGDRTYWNETYSFFNRNSLVYDTNYRIAGEKYLDIDRFTDYQIVNIFSGNWDWPDNNLDFVHDRLGADPRWRYLLWDTAAAWRYPIEHLTLEWAVRDTVRTDIKYNDKADVIWTTLFLRRLLENREYKNYFINRFADLLNTSFRSNAVRVLKDSLADWIRPEIGRESDRWNGGGIDTWENNQTVIDQFIDRRPEIQRSHIKKVFGLTHSITVTLEQGQGDGHLKLNSLDILQYPWSGRYFAGIPVTLHAIAAPGYKFTGWSDASLPADNVLTLGRSANFTIAANFIRVRQEIIYASIDAIRAHSAIISWQTKLPSTGEIKLKNSDRTEKSFVDSTVAVEHAVQLSGLQDSTDYNFTLTVPDPGGGFVSRSGSFRTPRAAETFKISTVSLDSLSHRRVLVSWQTTAPGTGRIEFGPDSSMNFRKNASPVFRKTHSLWLENLLSRQTYLLRIIAWTEHGADSSKSTIFSFTTKNPAAVAENDQTDVPEFFNVSQNFPNPFNAATKIRIAIPLHGQLTGRIFDVNGRQIYAFPAQHVQPGQTTLNWHGRDSHGQGCASGIYLMRATFRPAVGSAVTQNIELLLLK